MLKAIIIQAYIFDIYTLLSKALIIFMTQTPNLHINFIMPHQGQKETTANNAFLTFDALLNNGIRGDSNSNTPPSNPSNGDLWIIGSDPTGDWAKHANAISYFFDIWRFIQPKTGCMFWHIDQKNICVFNSTNWEFLTTRDTKK